jgi:hypothetical protein
MEEIDIDPSAPSAGEYVRLKKVYFEFDHSNGMDHAWGIRQDINGAWECISEIGLVIKTPLQVEFICTVERSGGDYLDFLSMKKILFPSFSCVLIS